MVLKRSYATDPENKVTKEKKSLLEFNVADVGINCDQYWRTKSVCVNQVRESKTNRLDLKVKGAVFDLAMVLLFLFRLMCWMLI
jgi:hypothetical protein